MGNREFNKWYQEWSQYAQRSHVDDATKMFAFCNNLNGALNQKMTLLTPQPTTLTAVVEKARDFDRNWRLYVGPGNSNRGPPRRRNNNAQVREVTTQEALNAEINATCGGPPFKKRGHLTFAERKHRMDNNLYLYCGKARHKAIECKAPPNKHPGTKLRQVDMISEEEIKDTNPLDESKVNQMSTNRFAPLMETDNIMEMSMDTSF